MAESNATLLARCPVPFLDLADYPPKRGELSSRYCGELTETLNCCLSCPLSEWVFSDEFPRSMRISHCFAIISLVCNSLLLLTFFALPKDKSHRHYLSIGLCVSLINISLAWVVPHAAQPSQCYDAVTPNNMQSSLSCAWSGAFFETGGMGIVVWILLRSLWTFLRIVFDFKHVEAFKWFSVATGIGLPLLFLAVSMSVTGVSYRLGDVCVPNSENAFLSFFLWLLVFAAIGYILTLATAFYCVFIYTRNILFGASGSSNPSGTSGSARPIIGGASTAGNSMSSSKRRRMAWRRVQKVLRHQWRSLVLSFIVLNESIFFGTAFVAQMRASAIARKPENFQKQYDWFLCLVLSEGDKDKCLPQSLVLEINERKILASLLLFSLIGIVVFALMVRRSMFVGWYELIRDPRRILRRSSVDDQDFIIISPKRISLGKPLESDLAVRRNASVVAQPEMPLVFDEKDGTVLTQELVGGSDTAMTSETPSASMKERTEDARVDEDDARLV